MLAMTLFPFDNGNDKKTDHDVIINIGCNIL